MELHSNALDGDDDKVSGGKKEEGEDGGSDEQTGTVQTLRRNPANGVGERRQKRKKAEGDCYKKPGNEKKAEEGRRSTQTPRSCLT